MIYFITRGDSWLVGFCATGTVRRSNFQIIHSTVILLYFSIGNLKIASGHLKFCSAQHESPQIQAYPAVKMLKMFQQEKYFEIYLLLLNLWWLDQIFHSKSLIDAGELTGQHRNDSHLTFSTISYCILESFKSVCIYT